MSDSGPLPFLAGSQCLGRAAGFMVEADYFGIVSANDIPDKFEKNAVDRKSVV